jgi:predicted Holliday junction resolvase-like endonuclease
LNIEVLVISTYIAILLLMGIFRTCCCTCNLKSERRRKKEGSREEKYNEVKNDSSSMIHEESTKKNKKSKLDEMIDEEDIEINTSTIKRKNKRRHDFIYT